ncbi:hypothetical protein [Streptomyces sp. FIT100]|uniref:hypothetical protein n=1 Tax=Streptomyces sp. FIT100 TaxID=2837956 RepID=UPI0021C5D708|nr:hypothetical protein [Streptomyces sp. FIT100]UUN28810.1 hypothetical protein KK483_22320 [Streptomyces sp. FIT100]
MSTNDLSWLRFARDGVTVAVRTDSGLVDHDFTTAELQDIYRCKVTTVDVGGRAIAVRPLLPEVGSGTGAYWAAVMGISSTMPPSCVGGAEEHDGRSLVNEGDLMPFSIPQFIAQVNGAATNRLGAADIRPVDGVDPYTQSFTFNTSFPIARDVYVVVETARLTETAIAAAFVGRGSLVCYDAAITELHGFGPLANCGSVAFTGES